MRKIGLLAALVSALLPVSYSYADAVIFSGSDVKALKQNLDLNGQAKVLTGTANPTSTAQNAPQGSVYLRIGASGGTAYVKQDSGSTTNWSPLGAAVSIRSEVFLTGGNGHGSTNTRVRRFVTASKNTGTAVTYADSAANGATFTINEDGIYAIAYHDGASSGAAIFGISVNSAQLTTDIQSITSGRVAYAAFASGNVLPAVTTLSLSTGDIVRAHTNAAPNYTGASDVSFRITKVGI